MPQKLSKAKSSKKDNTDIKIGRKAMLLIAGVVGVLGLFYFWGSQKSEVPGDFN